MVYNDATHEKSKIYMYFENEGIDSKEILIGKNKLLANYLFVVKDHIAGNQPNIT